MGIVRDGYIFLQDATALHVAVALRLPEVVQTLLERGVDPDKETTCFLFRKKSKIYTPRGLACFLASRSKHNEDIKKDYCTIVSIIHKHINSRSVSSYSYVSQETRVAAREHLGRLLSSEER